MIARLFREGNLQEVYRFHDEMLDRGLVPDDTTYDILLNRNFPKASALPGASHA